MATAAIERYWSQLAEMGCIITGKPAEIAHCHGGSIVLRLQEPKAKGKKLARMDWLVLPLCPELARAEYPGGLDRDVDAWEAANGTQAEHIDRLIVRTGIDVWALACIQTRTKYRRPTKLLPRRLSANV